MSGVEWRENREEVPGIKAEGFRKGGAPTCRPTVWWWRQMWVTRH